MWVSAKEDTGGTDIKMVGRHCISDQRSSLPNVHFVRGFRTLQGYCKVVDSFRVMETGSVPVLVGTRSSRRAVSAIGEG